MGNFPAVLIVRIVRIVRYLIVLIVLIVLLVSYHDGASSFCTLIAHRSLDLHIPLAHSTSFVQDIWEWPSSRQRCVLAGIFSIFAASSWYLILTLSLGNYSIERFRILIQSSWHHPDTILNHPHTILIVMRIASAHMQPIPEVNVEWGAHAGRGDK